MHGPFELAPGGYESVYVPGTGWTQVTASIHGTQPADRPKVGSRRERRRAANADGLVTSID